MKIRPYFEARRTPSYWEAEIGVSLTRSKYYHGEDHFYYDLSANINLWWCAIRIGLRY